MVPRLLLRNRVWISLNWNEAYELYGQASRILRAALRTLREVVLFQLDLDHSAGFSLTSCNFQLPWRTIGQLALFASEGLFCKEKAVRWIRCIRFAHFSSYNAFFLHESFKFTISLYFFNHFGSLNP